MPRIRQLRASEPAHISAEECNKRKNQPENPNDLLLKDKKAIVKKAPSVSFKDVSAWKPSGGLIYNTDLIKKIEDTTHNK